MAVTCDKQTYLQAINFFQFNFKNFFHEQNNQQLLSDNNSNSVLTNTDCYKNYRYPLQR